MGQTGNFAEQTHEEQFTPAVNDAQFTQSPTLDHRADLESKYCNHVAVKQNVLLRAKVNNSVLPSNESEMKNAYNSFIKDFALEKEDMSFEEFKSLTIDADVNQYRAKIIEALPKEKLDQAANMLPNKAELQAIENLPLEYEHIDAQQELFTKMSEIDQVVADRHHEAILEEELSPADEFMSIQNELDKINAMEAQHDQVVQETSSQSLGSSMEDNIAYLFDNPEQAIRNYNEMQKADTLENIADIAHDKAGEDFYQSIEAEDSIVVTKEGVDEIIKGTGKNSFYEALDNEKTMVGGQTLTGADNDLRQSMKEDVARGNISDESVGIQAAEISGLDEDVLARKEELEAIQVTLIEERGADIATEMAEARDNLGLEVMDINNIDDLAYAGREIQAAQLELEQAKERDDDHNLTYSL